MEKKNTMETSKDWQCGKALVDCLEYMFNTGIATDVTFIVGATRNKVQTHKFILISRSPVFYAMFEGPMAEKGEVVVPDIEKDSFTVLLRFLYTDKVDLTVTTVTAVLSAARKYCVDGLVDLCLKYLEKTTTADNACELLEVAHVYHEDDSKKKCLEVIQNNQTRCLESRGFTSLCASCVTSITSTDDLAVGEDKVFEAVLRWSDAECNRKGLELTDVNRRDVLGEILYTVRFPTMDLIYFTTEILKYRILSPEEMISVIRHINGISLTEDMPFSAKGRQHSFIKKIFRLKNSKKHWNHSGSSDAICFKSSANLTLHGIGVYGACDESADVNIKVEVYDSTHRCIYESTSVISSDPSETMYDLLFERCIDISKNVRYTIVTTENGPRTFKGYSGLSEISWDRGIVTFENSGKSINCTDVKTGQIPYLMLS